LKLVCSLRYQWNVNRGLEKYVPPLLEDQPVSTFYSFRSNFDHIVADVNVKL